MPAPTHLRREIEPRWVSEYVAATYPDLPHAYRVPLGPIPKALEEAWGPTKARRVYRPSRPEVDALVYPKGRLIMVEAKIFKVMDGLSKLPIYRSLVPTTPELAEYWTKPVTMQLLCVKPVPWVLEAATQAGVDVVAWSPDWVVAIWEERDKYWTPEAQQKREERKQVLRRLGYE